MSIVTVDANKCDFADCGHVWLSKKEPARCARCKRKKWNKNPEPDPIAGITVIHPGSGYIGEPLASDAIPLPNITPLVTYQIVSGTEGKVICQKEDGIITRLAHLHPDEEKPISVEPLPVFDKELVEPDSHIKLKNILETVKEHPKVGEKCPHGWANWLQCPKCNDRGR